ncbi:MAG: acetate--CoA ligase alpha subunit [archaeon]
MYGKKLERMFSPQTIAVIGASGTKGKVGYAVMSNLIGKGFEGVVYPVNPKRRSVQGVRAYKKIADIPDPIDLAIIVTPASTVPSIVEECGKACVSGVMIITAGFKEAGSDGKALSDKIVKIAKNHEMRIIGPNCLGFIRPSLNLNASFADKMGLPGNIAFISQSGALCTAILDWAEKQNVGFRYFASIGEMLDVGFHDLIDFFGKDPETGSILIYMESLSDARKFLSAARAFARTKPIIVLKAGKSSAGAKAAKSHTGSLAGDDAVFDAAFKRAGVLRVETIGELFDCAKTLALQKRPRGNRLAIITNAGGPGVIATDSLIHQGGQLAKLSSETLSQLDACLPPTWSKGNPIDVLGDADHDRFRKAVELCIADPGVDGVLTILTPQAMTDPSLIAKEMVNIENKYGKTMLTSWMGGNAVSHGRETLEKGGIPVFAIPEQGVRCFMYMHHYATHLDSLTQTPATIPHAFTPKTGKNQALIEGLMREGRFCLNEVESKTLLSNYGIPVTKHGIAKTPEQAASLAGKIGFPVVMKIASPDIIHKTDVGGVMIGIDSRHDARSTFRELIKRAKDKMPKADIHGVLVEEMVEKRYELIIGAKKDPLFGPIIVFGMGGVAVEVFKDTNIGLPPLNMALATRLMEETKIFRLLKGYRGMPGVDIKAIQFLLYKFAYLVSDFPQIKEIDINPFGIDEKGGIVLDAKVILDDKIGNKKIKPYSHLVISPYPKEYISKIRLKGKTDVTLRPIRPEDEPLEAEMFKEFSEETQRFRFFGPIKNITHDLLVRYTQIDYDREMAIIAEIKEKGKKRMAGVVRLIADAYNETAEFAIVVADPWQNQGLGDKLADYILRIAKKRSVKKVHAYFLKDNDIMRHMFEKRKFSIKSDGDVEYAEKVISK